MARTTANQQTAATTKKLKLVQDTPKVLKVDADGFVDALLKAGNDFVATRIEAIQARKIQAEGKTLRTSPMKDYPICVEGKEETWCFKAQEETDNTEGARA